MRILKSYYKTKQIRKVYPTSSIQWKKSHITGSWYRTETKIDYNVCHIWIKIHSTFETNLPGSSREFPLSSHTVKMANNTLSWCSRLQRMYEVYRATYQIEITSIIEIGSRDNWDKFRTDRITDGRTDEQTDSIITIYLIKNCRSLCYWRGW